MGVAHWKAPAGIGGTLARLAHSEQLWAAEALLQLWVYGGKGMQLGSGS